MTISLSRAVATFSSSGFGSVSFTGFWGSGGNRSGFWVGSSVSDKSSSHLTIFSDFCPAFTGLNQGDIFVDSKKALRRYVHFKRTSRTVASHQSLFARRAKLFLGASLRTLKTAALHLNVRRPLRSGFVPVRA